MKTAGLGAMLLLLFTTGCGGAGPAQPPAKGAGGATGAASAQPQAPLDSAVVARLPEQVELLGGRLRLRVPKGAKVAVRPHSIMAAAQSDDDETRVIVVPGDGELARFVLLARESFVLGTGNIDKDASKLLGKDTNEMSLGNAKVGKGLAAMAMRPKREIGSHGALFVLGAVVERADRSLCELSFFILPDMASERPDWEAKAAEILSTLEAGSSKLPGSREHQLDSGSGTTLSVVLPQPAAKTRQDGPDFYVYHLREIVAVGETGATLGVYFGGHPSQQWKQAGLDQTKVMTTPGTLLGKRTQWFTWSQEQGLTISEAIVPLGAHDYMHVFASGSAAKVSELRKAAESMRVTSG